MIEFVVQGKPIAQPRPRATTRRGGARRGGIRMIQADDDHAIHAYKQHVALFGRRAKPGGPLFEKLRVDLVFVLPAIGKPPKEPRPRSWAGVRPDLDNLVKAVLDALNGVLWLDDAQVVLLSAAKHRAADGEGPSTSVRVQPVEEVEPQRRRGRGEKANELGESEPDRAGDGRSIVRAHGPRR